MYESGYNTCDEAPEFSRHELNERSFWDSFKDTMKKQQESAEGVADGDEIEMEDGGAYDDYY